MVAGWSADLNMVANLPPVVSMDDIAIRDLPVSDQVIREVAGQLNAAMADKLHGPIGIVQTAVDHPRKVADQGRKRALAFLERSVSPLFLGHIAEQQQAADYCATRIMQR